MTKKASNNSATPTKQPASASKNKWKIGCISTSVLSGILLIAVLVLASQPPKIEYRYRQSPSTNSNNSNNPSSSTNNPDDNFGSSSGSNLPSNPNSYQKPEVITYTPGEKVGTSTKGVTIEIEQVIKNYQDYPSHQEPESGYEYVQVKLKFKNNSRNAIHLYSFDFYREDNNGMIDDALSSYHDNSTSYFPFSKEVAGGGTEVSGVMLFEVRKDATDQLTFLYEKDTTSKSILIAL